MNIFERITREKYKMRQRKMDKYKDKAKSLRIERAIIEKEVSAQKEYTDEKKAIDELNAEKNKNSFFHKVGEKINNNFSTRQPIKRGVRVRLGNNSMQSVFNQPEQKNIFNQTTSSINPFTIGSGNNPYDFSSSKDKKERTPKRRF